jgi:Na+-translocating ferredoxin:NAD+ oxidoreductase RnfD subunit
MQGVTRTPLPLAAKRPATTLVKTVAQFQNEPRQNRGLPPSALTIHSRAPNPIRFSHLHSQLPPFSVTLSRMPDSASPRVSVELDPRPSPLEYASLPPRSPLWPRIDLTHSGIDVSRYTSMHVLGALFPVTAGLMLYGWRALGVLIMVVGSAALGVVMWRRVGRRGCQVRYDQSLWLALLLGLTLPAHLFSGTNPSGEGNFAVWPILPAAGIALVAFIWALGGTGSGRIHPVLVAHLLVVVLFQDLLVPHYVLQRRYIFSGDILNAQLPVMGDDDSMRSRSPWTGQPGNTQAMATWSEPASKRLETYTSGLAAPERAWTSLESLLRDRMPPLEDIIVGGQPAAIGNGSAIALIIGGLFLLYRGLIDYRIPLLIFAATMVWLLVLPIPILITEDAEHWQWVAMRAHSVGPALAITFANYEIMASPLLFCSFFLATAPSVRPMARRARTIYALLIGTFAAIFQLYVSVSIGPYLALLAVSLATPTLDKLFPPRTLV